MRLVFRWKPDNLSLVFNWLHGNNLSFLLCYKRRSSNEVSISACARIIGLYTSCYGEEMFYEQTQQNNIRSSEKSITSYRYVRDGSRFPLHFHEHLEVIILVQGSLKVTVADTVIIGSEGDIVIIPPFLFHSMESVDTAPSQVIILQVTTSFFSSYFSTNKFYYTFRVPDNRYRVSNQILEKLGIKVDIEQIVLHSASWDYYEDRPNPFCENLSEEWKFNSFIFALFSKFLEHNLVSVSEFDESAIGDRKNSIVDLMVYVSQNPTEKFSLRDAADLTGRDYYQLSRDFKTITGMNYTDYQNVVRVNMSLELLWYSDLSITEIANELNFSTLSQFNRTFKQYMSMTPSMYRKAMVQKMSNDTQILI